MLPRLALAEQEAFPEERTQHTNGRPGAPIIVGVLDQDVVDRFRPVEDDRLTAEKAANDHVFFKGLGRECQKGIFAQCLGNLPPSHRGAQGARHRSKKWPGLTHLRHTGLDTLGWDRASTSSTNTESPTNPPVSNHASLKAATSPARSTKGATRARVASSTSPIGTPVNRSVGRPTRRAADASPAWRRATKTAT